MQIFEPNAMYLRTTRCCYRNYGVRSGIINSRRKYELLRNNDETKDLMDYCTVRRPKTYRHHCSDDSVPFIVFRVKHVSHPHTLHPNPSLTTARNPNGTAIEPQQLMTTSSAPSLDLEGQILGYGTCRKLWVPCATLLTLKLHLQGVIPPLNRLEPRRPVPALAPSGVMTFIIQGPSTKPCTTTSQIHQMPHVGHSARPVPVHGQGQLIQGTLGSTCLFGQSSPSLPLLLRPLG